MNETLSLILVTSLLALGGFGLYMFKSSDDATKDGSKYNEDEIFGSENLWGNNNDELDYDSQEHKVKSKSFQVKTKRNRKSSGTKRRY
jgi:hypothetical protein